MGVPASEPGEVGERSPIVRTPPRPPSLGERDGGAVEPSETAPRSRPSAARRAEPGPAFHGRIHVALYKARGGGDGPLVYLGHTDGTGEEMAKFNEEREAAEKRRRAILSGDYEGD